MNQIDIANEHLSKYINRLACPRCRSELVFENSMMSCMACGSTYPVVGEIIDFRVTAPREVTDMEDWTKHWSNDNQGSFSQKFFSVYRKAVFSRTVAYFINKYFPADGVFIEAGSGTSETSIRIDKHQGDRTLVAVDIILPVLEHTDPVMDSKLCGDIFRLPFQDNSLDGIWNVGVMEHFTHSQIDQIMSEFHRVLKDGAPLLMLWPGSYSVPQRMLRLAEKFINFRKTDDQFRFHPPEISQLNSPRQGREVCIRNGFSVVTVDAGLRSLMAFVTVVGTKTTKW